MPKRFSRGWLVACTLACINARPARHEKRGVSYGSTSNLGDLVSAAATDYDFDDLSAEKYVDKINDASNEESELDGASSTTVRNKYVALPPVLEPDAEMLPAHYTGVKPPGVDHMEIRFLDSASLGSNRKNSLADGTESKGYESSADEAVLSGSEASRGLNGESGSQREVSFEKGLKGEEAKENRKGEYAESAGKKKARQETEKHFNGRKDEAAGEKNASFEIDRHREKGHNAAGYHNIYHKDEYKKDADFYDNDHQGGHFRKHGRYDEKHIAAEGDFRKGGSRNSDFAEVEGVKGGNFERGRSAEEANGRVAESGHDGFFGKFDEFAKKAATGVGQSFGNNQETAVKV